MDQAGTTVPIGMFAPGNEMNTAIDDGIHLPCPTMAAPTDQVDSAANDGINLPLLSILCPGYKTNTTRPRLQLVTKSPPSAMARMLFDMNDADGSCIEAVHAELQ